YFSAAALLFAASFGEEQAGLLMAVIGFCTAIAVALRCLLPPRREYLGTVASAVLGLVYIAGGMTFLSLLRSVDVPAAVGTVGAWSFARRMGAVLLVLLPVWASDTGAFLAGGLWGHHRLAPVLSPNKTVEGAIGGFISTLLATLLLGAGWLKLPVGASLILGSAVGVACQLGDLVESAIKRDLGLKDFGVIFGPHGGLLDRFDGLLLAMPAGYAVLWLVLGPNAFTGHI
ncbi:MAG: phosphatidate cytidylyltransferase, partial [Armatimonadetes bacterium]|nr:phosphatidate cytidylyltransferase [Armatimonadota bacterium]